MKIGEVLHTMPTVGFNVEQVKHRNIEFTIWDVGGQDKIRALWKYYYQGTDGLVFLVDSNDTDRMELAAEELAHLLGQNELRDAVVLVLANKQDLPNAMAVSDIEGKLGLGKMRHRRWSVQACCATTGEGLLEGFDWLADQISK